MQPSYYQGSRIYGPIDKWGCSVVRQWPLRSPESHPGRKVEKLTVLQLDRLFSTCRAGTGEFEASSTQGTTQIHDRSPFRERFPKGLGDFHRIFEIFEVPKIEIVSQFRCQLKMFLYMSCSTSMNIRTCVPVCYTFMYMRT